MADVGIRHGLIGYRDRDISGLLENVVYLELRARRYTVSVGKLRDREVDFVAETQTERLYIQVCYLLASPETIDREYSVLEQIDDNYPKLVLSLDQVRPVDRGGIRWQNLIDFLLTDEPAEAKHDLTEFLRP
jgi:predicted AAA+ superfamily ATPase